MEQNLKKLLLKDLCARLYYKPTVLLSGKEHCVLCGIDGNEVYLNIDSDSFNVESIKPYLRPMSSITEEEKEELSHLLPKDWSVEIDKLNNFYFDMSPSILMEIDVFLNIIDWLNAYHFDYRGLIEKGLALEAKEGIYNIKN